MALKILSSSASSGAQIQAEGAGQQLMNATIIGNTTYYPTTQAWKDAGSPVGDLTHSIQIGTPPTQPTGTTQAQPTGTQPTGGVYIPPSPPITSIITIGNTTYYPTVQAWKDAKVIAGPER